MICGGRAVVRVPTRCVYSLLAFGSRMVPMPIRPDGYVILPGGTLFMYLEAELMIIRLAMLLALAII